MGANSTQAVGVTIYLMALTALAVGFARGGFIYYLATLVLLGVAIAIFLKCKPLENAEN